MIENNPLLKPRLRLSGTALFSRVPRASSTQVYESEDSEIDSMVRAFAERSGCDLIVAQQ